MDVIRAMDVQRLIMGMSAIIAAYAMESQSLFSRRALFLGNAFCLRDLALLASVNCFLHDLPTWPFSSWSPSIARSIHSRPHQPDNRVKISLIF